MEIFKVKVAINGRDLEAFVKSGVMSTIETGSHENKAQTPKTKVNIIVGQTKEEPVAWVQVSQFDEDRTVHITHEGWVSNKDGSLEPLSIFSATKASLTLVTNPPEEVIKCQMNAEFGVLSCCTSYGSGCYVTCCNCCCSDSVGCPGASCCA